MESVNYQRDRCAFCYSIVTKIIAIAQICLNLFVTGISGKITWDNLRRDRPWGRLFSSGGGLDSLDDLALYVLVVSFPSLILGLVLLKGSVQRKPSHLWMWLLHTFLNLFLLCFLVYLIPSLLGFGLISIFLAAILLVLLDLRGMVKQQQQRARQPEIVALGQDPGEWQIPVVNAISGDSRSGRPSDEQHMKALPILRLSG